jgi:type I restriction enzyme S subunit
MSFPRYPRYKDSGVGWLGEVPEHWEVQRLRFLCDIQTGDKDTENAVDDGLYPFFVRSQTVERIDTFTYDGEAVLTAGDGAGVGKVFHYYTGKFDFHQRVYMLCNFRSVSGRFVFNFMRENFCKVVLDGSAKSTVDSLRRPMFTNFPVAVPPPLEQTAITTFLDRETSKIDALVAEQRRLVELLKEKRQAVISHAVTKGLDPSVPMKASGVAWLGEVPAHWRSFRLKALFRQEKRQNFIDKPILSVYRDHGVVFKDSRTDNLNKTPEDVSLYQLVNAGDLVVNKMKAWQGSLGVSDLEGITSPDYAVFTSHHGEDSDFLHLILRSQAMVSVYRGISSGIRPDQWRIEPASFLELLVFLPPRLEQSEIVAHASRLINRYEMLVQEASKAIDLLLERRTALISAAVTGKIDVRGQP